MSVSLPSAAGRFFFLLPDSFFPSFALKNPPVQYHSAAREAGLRTAYEITDFVFKRHMMQSGMILLPQHRSHLTRISLIFSILRSPSFQRWPSGQRNKQWPPDHFFTRGLGMRHTLFSPFCAIPIEPWRVVRTVTSLTIAIVAAISVNR